MASALPPKELRDRFREFVLTALLHLENGVNYRALDLIDWDLHHITNRIRMASRTPDPHYRPLIADHSVPTLKFP